MPSTGTHNYQAARQIIITTTGNIDDLDVDGAAVLLMNNASLSTIRGIKAGYSGKDIVVIPIGAGNVELAHQNANSAAANRLINFNTAANTVLTPGVIAYYRRDDTTNRWRQVFQSNAFGQIVFPTTQNPSSDANVLDDYEEGTWTPTIGGGGGESGQVYSSQIGHYIKIGQMVQASCGVTLSTLGTITGQVQVKGLPFTSLNDGGAYRSVVPLFWINFTTAAVYVQGSLNENATAIGFFIATAATANMAGTNLLQADLSNTSRFVLTVTYRANS